MIRVTIEMIPGGNEERAYPMHIIEIANDLYTTLLNRRKGSYTYQISKKIKNQSVVWIKRGRVENFPRADKNSVHLLLAVLKDAYK